MDSDEDEEMDYEQPVGDSSSTDGWEPNRYFQKLVQNENREEEIDSTMKVGRSCKTKTEERLLEQAKKKLDE